MNTHIVVRSATNGTAFAFDTLPPVLANRNDHVRCELQTSRMPYNKNVARSWKTHMGRNRIFWTSRKVLGHLSCAEEQWTPSYHFVSNIFFFSRIGTFVYRNFKPNSDLFSLFFFFLPLDHSRNACDKLRLLWFITINHDFHPSSALKTSGIMIRSVMFPHRMFYFIDICDCIFFFFFDVASWTYLLFYLE